MKLESLNRKTIQLKLSFKRLVLFPRLGGEGGFWGNNMFFRGKGINRQKQTIVGGL